MDLVERKLDMDSRIPNLQEDEDAKSSKRLLRGYIQTVQAFPYFLVTMYTQQQFDILRRLIKYNAQAVLHIDSTGSLSSTLPEKYRSKRQFYYAMVVRLPEGKEVRTVPVLEFISSSHTAVALSSILHMFFMQ
jgi:hypothetical protein